MICGFKQTFPWGEPTYFREKILYGVGQAIWVTPRQIKKFPKIHTLRIGNRWKAGMSIQMAYGVRTKKYEQFNKGIPALETCKSVQTISIKVIADHPMKGNFYDIRIDGGKILQRHEVVQLALNDGFDSIFQFQDWFNKSFEGQIIHWTDFKY